MLVPPRSGAENMARDSALMRRAITTGETVVSVYSWKSPTLSFGRNQRAAGRYDLSRLRSRGLQLVRRPTGGRAILHDREITYSVTGRAGDSAGLRETYARINAVLLSALGRLGINAQIAKRSPGNAGGHTMTGPCFESPAEGEIVAEGRKLVGSAQWRENGSFLQHGSILVEDDQSSLASLLEENAAQSASIAAPATLTALMGRAPGAGEVSDALFDAVREIEDADAAPLDEAEIRDAAIASTPAFTDEAWTWRR